MPTTLMNANIVPAWNKKLGLWQDSSAAAFYLPNEYNSTYDCIPNKASRTGDQLLGANLYADRARIYNGIAYLPGTSGNYFSTPDNATISITGDTDYIARVNLVNYALTGSSGSGYQSIGSKWSDTSNQRGILFDIAGNGMLRLVQSTTGADFTRVFFSTIPVPYVNGTTMWLRWTLDVDNGASGSTATFYYAVDNGSNTEPTWTQLGSPVVVATAANTFDNATPLIVGGTNSGTVQLPNGQIYYTALKNGIGGAIAAEFNPSALGNYVYGWVSATNSLVWRTFTSIAYSPRDTYKVGPMQNGSSGFYTLANVYGGWASIAGVTGNNFTTPDAVINRLTGDIEIRAHIDLNSYTTGTENCIVAKWSPVPNGRSWTMTMQSGNLIIRLSNDGATNTSYNSTAALSSFIQDGGEILVRALIDVNNGSGGCSIQFFYSYDTNKSFADATWIQLGTTVTTAGVMSPFNTTQPVSVGCFADNTTFIQNGLIRRVEVLNGIGGTTAVLFDPSIVSDFATTWTCAVTGCVWTVTRSTVSDSNDGLRLTWSGSDYLYLPGSSLNYASAPDSPVLTFTDTLDVIVRVAFDDWTPSSTQTIIAKNTNTGNQRTFTIGLLSGGSIFMSASSDGITDGFNYTISNALGFTDGEARWLRITYEVSGGNTITNVYTAADSTTVPTSWTLNKNQVNPVSVSLFDSTAPLELGSYRIGTTSMMAGKMFYASVASTVGGSPVIEFDASKSGQEGYTDSISGLAWSILRPGTVSRKAVLVDAPCFSQATDDYFWIAHHPALNFGATESATVAVGFSGKSNVGSTQSKFAEKFGSSYTITAGYSLYNDGDNLATGRTYICDATINRSPVSGVSQSDNLKALASMVIDRTGSLLYRYYNTTSASINIAGVGAIRNTNPLYVGRALTAVQYFTGNFFGVSLFRRALTSAELTRLRTQLNAA